MRDDFKIGDGVGPSWRGHIRFYYILSIDRYVTHIEFEIHIEYRICCASYFSNILLQ